MSRWWSIFTSSFANECLGLEILSAVPVSITICKASVYHSSPLVDGGGETGHVGSDASADGENQGLAVGLQVQKPSAYLQNGVNVLGIFIGIDGETAPEIAARLQRLRNPGGIGFHVPVRQDVDGRIILQIRDGILNCPPGVYCASWFIIHCVEGY